MEQASKPISPGLDSRLTVNGVVEEYKKRTSGSAALALRAAGVMPGGNTRTGVHHYPYPTAMVRGSGCYLWDTDGNRYVDLYFNGLSLIHGHAYPAVIEAIASALDNGTAWPGPTEPQVALAETLCARLPSVEMVRFCNTGTEGAMLAAKIGRHATGRKLLLKAWHGYHGSYDDLEAGLHGNEEYPGRTILAPYGDAAAFEQALTDYGTEIAAVFIEPTMVGGVISPPADFLPRLRSATSQAGALLVFDECITFRSALGGMQEKTGVLPDLTVLGKFLGGGLPLAAVGGSQQLMSCLDPRRADHLYHSGSFNGNVLACVASLATLKELSSDRIATMDAHAERLQAEFTELTRSLGVPLSLTREGSMLGVHALDETSGPETTEREQRIITLFHLASLNAGVSFCERDRIMALASVFDDSMANETIERLERALQRMARDLDGMGEGGRV